ncbi:MAG: hypothetical protein ACRCV3_00630 [Desulfovibrionaceae bacterium]
MSLTGSDTKVAKACIECGKEGKTCCIFRNDDHMDLLFPTSYNECKRISDFLGITDPSSLFVQVDNTERFLQNINVLFPHEEEQLNVIFTEKKQHWTLPLRGTVKHCVFLTPNGCFLPRSVRPYLCQIFPFWIFDNSNICLFGQCALTEGKTLEETLQENNIHPTYLYALYSLLRASWGFKEGKITK